MSLFGQAKDLFKLRRQAKQIQEELKKVHVEGEVNGSFVTVSAKMEVVEIKPNPELLSSENAEKLAQDLKEAANKAFKKAQEVAAEKMKTVMGDLQGALGQQNPPA